MNTTTTPSTVHPVHDDPIAQALALLADAALADHLICDGSCNGLGSCNIAPVGPLAAAA